MSKRFKRILATAVACAWLVPAVAMAAPTPNLTQTINAGTLSTDILQSDGSTPVSAPTVGFPALNVGFTCQTNTATLGDTNNRVYVTNLATNNGWNLTMAATGGPTATWSDTNSHTYAYNNAAGSGCTGGQMTVNPTAATVNLDCSSACVSTNITKGSSTPLDSTGSSVVTLMSDSDGSAWKGYLTGVGLSQKIPASQPAGSYSLGMTITVTAI